jgi:hypothetical protein
MCFIKSLRLMNILERMVYLNNANIVKKKLQTILKILRIVLN